MVKRYEIPGLYLNWIPVGADIGGQAKIRRNSFLHHHNLLFFPLHFLKVV
jgi:hypothetical protein